MRDKTGGKRRIMIIDDDQGFLTAAARWLKPRYEVTSISGGEDLRKKLRAVNPDLVILDAFLRGNEGFELGRALKPEKEGRSVPVLLTMPRERDSFYGRSLFIEGEGILGKPSSRPVLNAAVKAILRDRMD